MKWKYFLIIFLLITSLAFSQTEVNSCITTVNDNALIQATSNDGIYITSHGTLRVLVVFVRFKDDNSTVSGWPAGSPPDFMNTYIDSTTSMNSTNLVNLTNYFKQMSSNNFNVVGRAIYVETPKNKSEYGSSPDRYTATKDVLQNSVDPIINFNLYDNWSSTSTYTHSNTPDNVVDMIIMVWRGLVFQNGAWLGEASLGYGAAFTVENGTKTVRAGFGLNNGSGITAQYWGSRDVKYNFHTVIHELGHWLLGGPHPYNSYERQEHSFWGILRHSSEGICANTYEREKVGWIAPTSISSNVQNASLGDYLSSCNAYKYHPSNGATNEYYYFENHQKVSIYDDATINTNDKGIFVLHFQSGYSESNNIRCKISEGQWDWQNPSSSTCWSVPVPAFKQTAVNRNGRNKRDMLSDANGNGDWLFSLLDEYNIPTCGGYQHGELTDNTFNTGYNNVFSPYSNPNTNTWINSPTNFTMEVKSQSGSTVYADFYLTNPLAGSPSKVQNLHFTYSNPDHPSLGWDVNTESDISSYRIYRSYDNTAFDLAGIVSHPTNTFVDLAVSYTKPIWAKSVKYYVVAVDNTSLSSVPSDQVETIGIMNPLPKINTDDFANVKATDNFELLSNYPNPFNPSTKISYSLPEASFVTLKVYDVLGREIVTLVNETKPSGKYELEFKASELPSGTYIYKLTAGNNISVKKMLLVK